MNEQGKKILINKTTLFSLKAELFKKQEEIKEKRQLPLHKLENFKPPVKSNVKEKPDKEYKKSFKDSLKAVDTEELEACRKAKLVLEKKAALYEHLSDPSGNSELAGRFLVDFNTKKQQEPPTNTCISDENEPIEKEENIITNQDNGADEWTEYTDCLGRTRKCLKSDYELFVWRDKELLKTMTGRSAKESSEDESTKKSEKPLLVEKTNDYLQTLREKWEQKEKELLAKDKDIHYQDLLFDEARMHGVGYYAFSTDESERKKQMEELMKRRQETLSAQKETEETRKKMEELMTARVAAARARQRLRAGLPPEDPQEMKEVFEQRLLQFLNEQKDEVDAKAKEEEKRLKEEQENERQKLREAYIREWDLGKEGVKDKVKFREMSQEEYVEQQRNKRIDEFAPPQASSSKNNQCFDESGNLVGSEVKNKSWDDVRPKARTPTPPHIGDLSFLNEQKGLYFSTSMKPKFKNFVQAQEPTPIINELDVEEESPSNISKRKLDSGIEIEPPTTYDYYGPVPKYTKSEKPFYSDIREAYSQGTRSLESKTNTKRLCNQYDFTFD